MQTPYAALVSVIVGVTNIIPFFGPYLGAIPSAILILVVDPMHPLNCVYFVLFILVLQQFDGNFLGPKILGNSTGLTGFLGYFCNHGIRRIVRNPWHDRRCAHFCGNLCGD